MVWIQSERQEVCGSKIVASLQNLPGVKEAAMRHCFVVLNIPQLLIFEESHIGKYSCMQPHKQNLAYFSNKGYGVVHRFNKILGNQIQKTGQDQESRVAPHSLAQAGDNSCVRVPALPFLWAVSQLHLGA